MTTSIPPTKLAQGVRRPRAVRDNRGFTLLEVTIATVLSSVVLAAVLGAFLMIGRTSFNAGNYTQNEAEIRHALDVFGSDARLAKDIRWSSDTEVSLIVATPAGLDRRVTYAYDADPSSPTHRSFYRITVSDPTAAPREVLAREVSELSFKRFKLERAGSAENHAINDLETKQLQLTLRASRKGATTVAASQTGVSANFILRNKRVSN